LSDSVFSPASLVPVRDFQLLLDENAEAVESILREHGVPLVDADGALL
jgi:hypothetical protein